MKNTNKKAFTLVELLVVIAIIAILFVVLISKVDFATDKAKATGVQTDFRSFQMAMETVAREYAGFDALIEVDDKGTPDDASDDTVSYAKLQDALNENLDKKLQVTIAADGKITLTAQDPWRELYTGEVVRGVENEHRGYIAFYSKGANLAKTASVAYDTANDEVTHTNTGDDYVIATVYSLGEGYGEVVTTTSGFSSNQ
jgi:prepilin-type N-terminal cleavage/methylation domain-containing protein